LKRLALLLFPPLKRLYDEDGRWRPNDKGQGVKLAKEAAFLNRKCMKEDIGVMFLTKHSVNSG
jgi:hypothetical protein